MANTKLSWTLLERCVIKFRFLDKYVPNCNLYPVHQHKQILGRLSGYSLNKMQKFMISYLKQFQTILLFVHATRQKDFRLHLAATESLLKYFFTHDHQSYARLLLCKQHQSEELTNGRFGTCSQHGPLIMGFGGKVGFTPNDIALD